MKSKLLARRYALALLLTAKKRGELETVKADLKSLELLFQDEPDLRHFLESPGIGDEDKHRLVDATLKGQVSTTCLDFIHLLLDRYRADHFDWILEQFEDVYEDDQGIQRIQVTTASDLDESQHRNLTEHLRRLTPQRVLLDHRVDPEIVGGMIIKLNHDVLDGSLKKKLHDLKETLAAVRVL